MQLAGWIGTSEIHWLHIPGWMGTWFSLFNNWETFAGQFIALALVLGSYVLAQYIRVWRPRKRGLAAARPAGEIPNVPADSPAAGPAAAGPAGAGAVLTSRT
jgi:high-affinity iron transporter